MVSGRSGLPCPDRSREESEKRAQWPGDASAVSGVSRVDDSRERERREGAKRGSEERERREPSRSASRLKLEVASWKFQVASWKEVQSSVLSPVKMSLIMSNVKFNPRGKHSTCNLLSSTLVNS